MTPSEHLSVLRILDANFNRASEGLRTIEEFARFHQNDRFLTGKLKEARHRLTQAFASLPADHLLAARDTLADQGTTITTPTEMERSSLTALVAANFSRVQQSLRVMEEYGKTVSGNFAKQIETLRYEMYTLEKATSRLTASSERLQATRLYVLIDGDRDEGAFVARARLLVSGGVDMIQLRDKNLGDRELLARAKLTREATTGTQTLFIMNDRPDLAVLSQADGVHVGQDELSVSEVRKIVGPDAIVGVSTHNLAQVRQAILDGANYIGCGPTFHSSTKTFDEFPGLAFLREVCAETSLPAFAIGGIDHDNLADVLATGIKRVAVSGALSCASLDDVQSWKKRLP